MNKLIVFYCVVCVVVVATCIAMGYLSFLLKCLVAFLIFFVIMIHYDYTKGNF